MYVCTTDAELEYRITIILIADQIINVKFKHFVLLFSDFDINLCTPSLLLKSQASHRLFTN